MATEECRNCRFSKTIDRALFCRRYPPEAGVGFPQTRPADWCGEWMAMRPGAGLPAGITPPSRPSRDAVVIDGSKRSSARVRP